MLITKLAKSVDDQTLNAMHENLAALKLNHLNDGKNDNDNEEEKTDVENESVKEIVVAWRVHFVSNTATGS